MRSGFPCVVGLALRLAGSGAPTRPMADSLSITLSRWKPFATSVVPHTTKVDVPLPGGKKKKVKVEEEFIAFRATMGQLRGVWQRVKALGREGEADGTKSVPGVRSSHAVSVVDGKLYLIGGEAKAREPVGMAVFTLSGLSSDGQTMAEWTCVEPLHGPPSRNAHAQAAIAQRIYCFGGRKGIELEEDNLADLWTFDTETREWAEIKGMSGDVPCPRSYHVACAIGGLLYVFGGCSANGRLADLYSFSPQTKVWKRLPDPPGLAGRGGATLEGVRDAQGLLNLVLFSGFEGKESKDHLTYSVKDQQWTVHPKHQTLEPRSVCSSFTIPSSALTNSNTKEKEEEEAEDLVIVFGGEIAPSERGHEGAGSFSDEVFALNSSGVVAQVETGTNNHTGTKPAPRGWAYGTSLSPKSGIFYGGLTGSDKNPTRLEDTWILTLTSK